MNINLWDKKTNFAVVEQMFEPGHSFELDSHSLTIHIRNYSLNNHI
jgi:hypothetical protein